MLIFDKIAIASDHGGFKLKRQLIQHLKNIECIDFGTDSDFQSVDYPDYANKVTEYIIENQNTCGILICKTGVGMSIAANKIKNIRAVLAYKNIEIIKLSREHNNCNVICFGADYITADQAIKFIETFVNTPFSGKRHQNRLNKIK